MGWTHTDLTAVSGARPALTAPWAYMFDAQGTQHVVHIAYDGHVIELWSDSSGWHHNDLSIAAGAPTVTNDSRGNRAAGYVFAAEGTQHVFYVPSDCHVHELWWDGGGGWHHNDLTNVVPGTSLSLVQGPCAFVFDAEGTQHVDYVASDFHVHELWWQNGAWHHNDITAAASAPPAADGSRPVGYVFADQATQHVDYVGMDGHIHELWWQAGHWNHNDLTAATGSPLPDTSGLAAYTFAAEGTQHVDYVSQDHHVHELWWNSDGWHDEDLTAASGAPVLGWTVLCAYAFEAQRTQHVVCAGDDGSMHELWWASDGWHYTDLTPQIQSALAALAMPAGYVFSQQGTQHVDYVGIVDNHIYELRWQRESPPIDPVPPPSGAAE